jgi:prepilin signal peptidase PulO-like enzyme (type II secretory pathway)
MEIYSGFGLLVALCVGSAIDIRSRRMPDWLTLPLIVAWLVYAVSDGLGGGLWSLIGAILGFLSLYLVSRLCLHLRHQHGLGLGDAKLLAGAGLVRSISRQLCFRCNTRAAVRSLLASRGAGSIVADDAAVWTVSDRRVIYLLVY